MEFLQFCAICWSLIGTILVILKSEKGMYFWTAANIAFIFHYFNEQKWNEVILFSIYLVSSLYGIMTWKKELTYHSEMLGTWEHVKTGNTYIVERVIVDATNARRGILVVLYRSKKDNEQYVRDYVEFTTVDLNTGLPRFRKIS